MNEWDQQDAKLENDEQIQITDLDPAGIRSRRRIEKIIRILHKSLVTPWIRYGLLGSLIIILLGSIFLQTRWPLNINGFTSPTPISLIDPVEDYLNTAFSDHQVYIQSENSTVTAYQAESGRTLWSFRLPGKAFMLATNQTLYCYTSAESRLLALNASNGHLLWEHDMPAPGPIPLEQSDDALYAGTRDGTIYAFQAREGLLRWTYRYNQTNDLVMPLGNVMTARNGIVEIHSSNGSVHILHAIDGRESIQLSLSNDVYPLLSPSLIDRPLIYILPNPDIPSTQSIQVFRTTDGRRLWTLHVPSASGSVLENNGVVILHNADGSLTALRGSDGSTLWTYKPDSGKTIIGPPTANNGVLYLFLANNTRTNNTLVSIRVRDGQSTWSTPISAANTRFLLTSDINYYFDNGMVFLTSTAFTEVDNALLQINQVYALRASDGKVVWASPIGESSPENFFSLQAGTFYIALKDGAVDAWQASNGKHLWRYQIRGSTATPLAPEGNRSIVYLSNDRGRLDVLRISDGKVLWSSPDTS